MDETDLEDVRTRPVDPRRYPDDAERIRDIAVRRAEIAEARLRLVGEDYTAAVSLIRSLHGRLLRTERLTDRDDELDRRCRVFLAARGEAGPDGVGKLDDEARPRSAGGE